jgi:hypothetical protein
MIRERRLAAGPRDLDAKGTHAVGGAGSHRVGLGLVHGRDSPVIIASFTELCPLRTMPSGGNGCAGTNEHEVACSQRGDRDLLRAAVDLADGGARQQLGELLECALCLDDRTHLDPVAEEHHGDECRELFLERHPRVAERDRGAEDERHRDRKRNESHHARQSRPKLSRGALQEDRASVNEHRRAEERRDPFCARQQRGMTAGQTGEHLTPDEGRGSQRK